MLRISIDIGGTFTDVVAETTAGLHSIKILTTPESPDKGALDGVDRLLGDLGLTYGDITSVVHGTTLATNALIERRGAKMAFVTTAGFRDVLDMRYEKRFEQYDLNIEMPTSLVPRPLRFGVTERMLADGSVLNAPKPAEIDALAAELIGQNVQAVAIGFLHSYRDPSHENAVAAQLRALLPPDITICQSAEVAGEIREYERFSTVCANAYVRPLMSQYLAKLTQNLSARGFNGSFLMMLSGGGLTTLEQAVRFPIRLVESGPAGGVALAAYVAQEMGSEKTLSLDIGGTTAKICFIENGVPQTTRKFEVARAWRDIKGSGLPVRVPTVELIEIGAGGGSIASIDMLGRLKVGPKSAGSAPGPAAYGRGGESATITDAHLIIGNIATDGFAGGMIDLAPDAAMTAIKTQIQEPMGLECTATAAAGIVELADETMANAARVHGIELGHDVAQFDLLVTGGGGALHGARIAEKLGIRRIIVPQNAGVGSAIGFLRTPIAFESAISVIATLANVDIDTLSKRIEQQKTYVRATVEDVVPRDRVETSIKAELRYLGQGLEIILDLSEEVGLAQALAGLETSFLARYEALVGFTLKDIDIEIVSLSVSAREIQETVVATSVMEISSAQPTSRDVFDLSTKATRSYAVLDRPTVPKTPITGPAVISEAQTTTLVRTGWSVATCDLGHLVLVRKQP